MAEGQAELGHEGGRVARWERGQAQPEYGTLAKIALTFLMIGIFMQFLIDSQTGGMGWDGAKAASVVTGVRRGR